MRSRAFFDHRRKRPFLYKHHAIYSFLLHMLWMGLTVIPWATVVVIVSPSARPRCTGCARAG